MQRRNMSESHESIAIRQLQKRAHEDRYVVESFGPWLYYAVFDGHGRPVSVASAGYVKTAHAEHVVTYCSELLHVRLAQRLTDVPETVDMPTLLKELFVAFDREMRGLGRLYGCTCTLVLIQKEWGRVYQVNLGDSRSLLMNREGLVSASTDHVPALAEERE